MKKAEFLDYVDDMLDAISKMTNFLSGFDFVTFSKDDNTQFAVIRALEIIGDQDYFLQETRRFSALHTASALQGSTDKLEWRIA